MKRHTSALIAALLIAAALMAGCQQPGQSIASDPVQAVKDIVEKQAEIKTQHVDLTLDLKLKIEGLSSSDPSTAQTAALFRDFKASASAAGDVDNAKSDFSLKGTADLGMFTAFLLPEGVEKLEFELVKVGETMYSRLVGQEWNESPVETSTSGSGASPADVNKQLRDLLKKVAKAERLGDETIDGVGAYHFKVTLDAVELIAEAAKLAQQSGGEVDQTQLAQASDLLKNSDLTLEMWVGKADLYIRQQILHLGLNLKNIPDAPPEATVNADINLTVKNSKLNEAVTISKPK
ncbi:MAG TPA: hypothetical protein VJ754_04530 [Anaerolineae bacterium]|nr:hypothetical protein [Anaerolineae bacterium]